MKIPARTIFKTYSNALSKIYPEQEAKSLTFWLLDFYLQIKRKDILADKEVEIAPVLQDAFEQILTGRPIQQVTGWAPFYGREFKVNEDVLIPRNETEELVHLIITETSIPHPKILDIGTGSGCIPITLALEISEADVYAIDISEAALSIAIGNSEFLGGYVTFQKLDILNEEIPFHDLDIIVSNPPYILEQEKSLMHKNVLDFEPHLALFVKDETPLIFYIEIANKAKKALKKGGKLYFEINEAYGKETMDLMIKEGYDQVKILKDLNGKLRIVSGILP